MFQHGAAWLLRGGAVSELLAQRQCPELFGEFDRGITSAVAAHRQLTGTKPRPARGVIRPPASPMLAAPASAELELEAA